MRTSTTGASAVTVMVSDSCTFMVKTRRAVWPMRIVTSWLAGANPGSSTPTLYIPGGSAGMMMRPATSETEARWAPVSVLTTRPVTPGIGSACSSTVLISIVPVETCAATGSASPMTSANPTVTSILSCFPLSMIPSSYSLSSGTVLPFPRRSTPFRKMRIKPSTA